ncbi:MAG: inositol-3-phosphate synthase [Actinobacteria bacterium]|nr:inositol-3-phosphate synthase [Actinomycetota bacterium]
MRVAIVGVGNCANSLIQGVEYYKNAPIDQEIPGLMNVVVGGYHVRDVKFVAAFDVDSKKVGKDIVDAMWASENNTIKFCDVPKTGIKVLKGNTLDGLGVFIASTPEWADKFKKAGLPIVGDDIKSQVGATITHRVLAKLFQDRGVKVDRTYQLNVGGNMDFKNMLERDRLESKKISKTQSVTSQLDYELGAGNVHIGPSDYVQWLDDRKWAFVRLEGRAFGDVPLNIEYKLEVWDSPNSAGVIIDAVRCAKLALDRGIGGPLLSPSSYFMKSPPEQYSDEEAHNRTQEFIDGRRER